MLQIRGKKIHRNNKIKYKSLILRWSMNNKNLLKKESKTAENYKNQNSITKNNKKCRE